MRVKNGLQPACVRACSFGALTCVTEEEYLVGNGEKACNMLLKQLAPKKKA